MKEDQEQVIIEHLARQLHQDSVVEDIQPVLCADEHKSMWLVILTTAQSWQHHIVIITADQVQHFFQNHPNYPE